MRRLTPMFASAAAVLFGFGLVACKGKMAKIDGLRDALASGDASEIKEATEGFPACAEKEPVALAPGQPSPRASECFDAIATAFGSKRGFRSLPADQASGATAALLITRDHRGDWLARADAWLSALKDGEGSGIDALRLAVARAMESAAPAVGRRIETEADARATMKAVAAAIPGACPAYAMLGAGAAVDKMRPALAPDHAACVQHDLKRREGMGAGYGAGVFRGLEGSLALWREAERALRLGVDHASPKVKNALAPKIARIEAATQKNETKKLPGTRSTAVLNALGDLHADAGIVLWEKDAGADGGVDAGAKRPRVRLKNPKLQPLIDGR